MWNTLAENGQSDLMMPGSVVLVLIISRPCIFELHPCKSSNRSLKYLDEIMDYFCFNRPYSKNGGRYRAYVRRWNIVRALKIHNRFRLSTWGFQKEKIEGGSHRAS